MTDARTHPGAEPEPRPQPPTIQENQAGDHSKATGVGYTEASFLEAGLSPDVAAHLAARLAYLSVVCPVCRAPVGMRCGFQSRSRWKSMALGKCHKDRRAAVPTG